MRYARAVLISVVEEASGAAGRGAGSFLGGFLNNPAVVILGALGIVFLFFGGDIRKAFGSLGESISKIGSVSLPDINFPDFNFPEFPSLPDINLSLGGTTDAITDTISNLQNQISKILAGGNFQQITNPDDLFEGAISPDDPLATIPRTDCECGLSIVQDASGNITQKCIECEEQTAFKPPADPPVTISDEIELSFQPAPIDTSIQIASSIETDSFFEGGGRFVRRWLYN